MGNSNGGKKSTGRNGRVRAPKEIPKVSTGIRGLDEILAGGLPKGRTALVCGGPGAGKSILGLEFLATRAANGIPGIFVTFEERADAVRENAATIGLDLAALEKKKMLYIMECRPDPHTVLSGDFSLEGTMAILGGKIREMSAVNIVIDAVDVLMRLFDNPSLERNELHALHNWLTENNLTTIITMKKDEYTMARYSYLDYLADCVIEMDQRQMDQVTTRRIRVVKFRGSNVSNNEHPFVIRGGLRIIPLSSVSLRHLPMEKRISTGHKGLDEMLGGGYLQGACVLIAGPTGTGKTTLACILAEGAARRRERTVFISFEESVESVLCNMLSPGIDLRSAARRGYLVFHSVMPEAMSAEAHLVTAMDIIAEQHPKYVVLDAISSCGRMGSTQIASEYVTRLVNHCKEQGITLLMLNQSSGVNPSEEISGMGVSSLVDTLIFLRYVEDGSGIRRAMNILKARGTSHETDFMQFAITDNGIRLWPFPADFIANRQILNDSIEPAAAPSVARKGGRL